MMKRFVFRLAAFAATAVLLLSGCQSETFEMDQYHKMYGSASDDVGALIEQVADQNVYFGHQSVGYNIMDGVQQWELESGINLSMESSRDFASLPENSFVHFKVGANREPRGKIDDFVNLVDQIPAEENAIAFFKFCYADFHESTEVNDLFSYYSEKMLYLKDKHPNITFLASTVPAMAVQKGWRAAAKKVLGRAPYGYLQNIKLFEFNQRLLTEFDGILPVFDLGLVEVTRPDGTIETYRHKGNDYPCMPDYYASDYGHLNDFGARTVSYNMLAFLAEELK
jgi:hypothetical protein